LRKDCSNFAGLIDETYVKIHGKWRYLYRAIDKHGIPVDFLLTAKRNANAAKRFFRKMLENHPLLAPNKIGTDGASVYPATILDAVNAGLIPPNPLHRISKHLQQGIESDHFHVKKNMPKVGFEAMLWLKKGFGFAGEWTVRKQNGLLACCFGLQMVNEALVSG
jgi:IS6 family transposase